MRQTVTERALTTDTLVREQLPGQDRLGQNRVDFGGMKYDL